MPRVSAIIPCYNHGRFLAGAVDSVLGQSLAAHEVIVVDDGSRDETPAVAARYGGSVRYLRKENAGLSAARNTGLLAATGDFVHFLDADDYVLRDMYARMAQAVERHPEGTVFYGGHVKVDLAGAVLETKEAPRFPADPLVALLAGESFPCHVVVLRREAFANVGLFDVDLDSSEDWDLWIRLAAAGARFVAVPGVVAAYRKYPGTMSTDPERMLRAQLRVLGKQAGRGLGREREQALKAGLRRFRMQFLRRLLEGLGADGRGEALRRLARQALRDPATLGVLLSWGAGAAGRRLRRAVAPSAT